MDTRDLHDKGLKLRREMFGRDAVEQRMTALGAFGEPLQNMINAYAYGDVWSRPALPLKTKSLAAIAMTAAIGRANELRVHVNGALANGCTRSIAGFRRRSRAIASRSTCCASAERCERAPVSLRPRPARPGPRADGSTRWSCAIHCK
jgi:4-carboxymuconolactone decarboxylase